MAVLEAVTSFAQGKQAKRQAEQNALIDEADARIALDDARSEAAIEQRRGARIQAEQAVGFAGGGVVAGSGTPLQLAAQEVVKAEMRASGALRRGAFESSRRRQAAALQRRRGRAAERAGLISGVSTLGTKAIETFSRSDG